MDAKFYAATQAMDEARHVELYQRFIRDKIGLYYPINPDLASLLSDALREHYDFNITVNETSSKAAEHLITVRAYDRYENVGLAKMVIPAGQ